MRKARYFLIIVASLMMTVPIMAKKVKTAEIKDGVLTDLRYGYTLDVPDNWKTKTYKENEEEPKILRALMMQKNYQINREARDLDGPFTIPEIQIYVRPDTMGAETFLKMIQDAVLSHGSEDDIINQMNLVLSGEYVAKQEVELGGQKFLQAIFKRNWNRELYTDPNDPKYRQYGGLILQKIHDVHEVYICNYEGNLYVIQGIVENEFYSPVKPEFGKIISSFSFGAAADTTAGTPEK